MRRGVALRSAAQRCAARLCAMHMCVYMAGRLRLERSILSAGRIANGQIARRAVGRAGGRMDGRAGGRTVGRAGRTVGRTGAFAGGRVGREGESSSSSTIFSIRSSPARTSRPSKLVMMSLSVGRCRLVSPNSPPRARVIHTARHARASQHSSCRAPRAAWVCYGTERWWRAPFGTRCL